jgi:hypothetical protein
MYNYLNMMLINIYNIIINFAIKRNVYLLANEMYIAILI